jgi:ADP-heptose:LPS heptosyltransferase
MILRTDRIGDLLVSTPAIRNLRTALPHARLTLVTSPLCADVLRGWDGIDTVEVYDVAATRAVRREVARRLSRARPDVVFAFTPQSRIYRLTRRIGAPVRVGFGYRSRPLDLAVARVTLTHSVFSRVPEAAHRAHEVPHHADELLALLRALDLPAPRRPMEVPVAEADRAWTRDLLAGRGTLPAPFVVHLSHKWLDDGWNADDVGGLVDAIGRVDSCRRVVLTVGPADRELWNAVQAKLPPTPDAHGPLVVLDNLTFGRWAAVVASSVLAVSPDTGAIHLSSATRRPVVGVYAEHRFHVLSRQWAPWMVPCRTLSKGRGEAGVHAITAAAESLLREVAPGSLRA